MLERCSFDDGDTLTGGCLALKNVLQMLKNGRAMLVALRNAHGWRLKEVDV